MPSIPFYALDADLDLVLDHLNADPEIAFIVANGPGLWRAVERRAGLPTGHHLLWHRRGGSPPLIDREGDGVIDDPLAGWEERVTSAIPGVPYFGSVPMIIAFDVAHEKGKLVPMSAFGWIGDRYRAIGQGAAKDTTKWWNALEKWIRERTREVRRGGAAGASAGGTVAAFPAAAARLDAGAPGELNPPTP
jgi:hypothetical protein